METNVRVTEGRFHSCWLKPTFPKNKGGATCQIWKRRGHCLEGYQSGYARNHIWLCHEVCWVTRRDDWSSEPEFPHVVCIMTLRAGVLSSSWVIHYFIDFSESSLSSQTVSLFWFNCCDSYIFCMPTAPVIVEGTKWFPINFRFINRMRYLWINLLWIFLCMELHRKLFLMWLVV